MKLVSAWLSINCRFAQVVKQKTKPAKPTVPMHLHPPSKDDDEGYDRAETYFSIGHGVDDEETPHHYLWIFNPVTKEIESADMSQGVHAGVWPDYEAFPFKGRYEADTGSLSIVNQNKFRSPPNWLERKIREHFSQVPGVGITNIHVF